MKLVNHISAKGVNRRIDIGLLMDEETSEYFFVVRTKRLADRATRKILSTDTVYSVETMSMLTGLLMHFMEDAEVNMKINKYMGYPRYQVGTNLKSLTNKPNNP